MFFRKTNIALTAAALAVLFATSAPAWAEWGALAGGIQGNRVSVGSAINYNTAAEASAAALEQCRSNGVGNCRVVSTFTGCGYITISTDGSDNVAYGYGATAKEAYDECYKRVIGGNCKTNTIGGCNRR